MVQDIPYTLSPLNKEFTMKTNRFLSIVFVFVSSIFADTIYLRDGQEVKDAVVTEVGDGDVKYKIGQREVVYTAKKSDIMMILYNDGTKDLFNAEQTAKTENSKKGEIRTGIRGAVNASIPLLSGDFGWPGFTIGGIINFPFSNTMDFRTEFNLAYRTPILRGEFNTINMEVEKINSLEIAMGINLLWHHRIGFFYSEGGVQLGTPIVSIDNGNRSTIDFGPILGFGGNINENFALGLRCIYYVTEFEKEDSEHNHNLLQIELGLSYMF